MNIVARAEPRYYIELTEADAVLIHDVALKRAFRQPGKFSKTVELTAAWAQYLELRKDYRLTCLQAGNDVTTSKTVNATHTQLQSVLEALDKTGPMDVERATRLASIRSLFSTVMDTATRQFRQFEVSMSSFELMEPLKD